MEDGLDSIPHVIRVQPISFPIPPSTVGRSLPDREVSRETSQDAYVQFVFYTNPTYPLDSDTTLLKDTFSHPPTSNKKVFDPFEIYLRIKKLHEGRFKTWQELATDLGVERGEVDENGRCQRASQYVVRLKRWMKTSHVDAFFQYLIGLPHEYYLKVPPLNDPLPVEGRDGVPASEDLALRALDPSLKPKRGRKRTDSTMEDLPPAQRNTFSATPSDERRSYFVTPSSAFPRSAFPQSAGTDTLGHDPWSAISPWPSQLGMSPTEPRSAFSAFGADPSIGTPNIANRLNKFSVNGSPAGPRTRVNGSLSPAQQRRATPPIRGRSGLSNNQALDTLNTALPPQKTAPEAPMSAVSAASTASKRERQRLQLQVPRTMGNPIRLMTPPAPVVADVESQGHVIDSDVSIEIVDQAAQTSAVHNEIESLKRTLASELLRADLVGRRERLTGTEAKKLAAAVMHNIGLTSDGKPAVGALITGALQLGLAHVISIQGLSFPRAPSEWTVTIRQILLDHDGYQMTPEDLPDHEETGLYRKAWAVDLSWTVKTGALLGTFVIRDIDLDCSERYRGQDSSRAASGQHDTVGLGLTAGE